MTDTDTSASQDESEERVWQQVIPRRDVAPPTDKVSATRGGGPDAAPEELPYEVVGRPEPPPVPNGWYAICSSAELPVGGTHSTIAVARELVAFRGKDGVAHVLDAYCPHMGAHLGGGDVHVDNLACPYHGWQFAGDGTVVEIPYSDARIPSRACVRSYPVNEVNGMVLFWYHAGGEAPTYEVPHVEEIDDAGYTDAVVYRTEFVASLQDMAENNVDYTHFYFVHGRAGLDESTSKFTTDGPLSKVVETFEDVGLTFTRWTYGPGIALLRVPDMMTVLTATTAIDRRHVLLLWHFYLPRAMESLAEDVVEGVTGPYGLAADKPIWRDKVFLERPLLVKGDGPITEFRRWYAQFYEGN